MRKARWIVASLVAFALVASACGDDEESPAAQTTAPAGGAQTTAAGGGASASTCKLDKSYKIIGLAEKPPEGPNAVPDYSNGFDLAIEELNKAGGICGQKVDYERLPMSPTDNASAKQNLLAALDKKADALIGIPNSATVIALANDIKTGGTPILFGSASVGIFVGSPAASNVSSEWGFVLRPRNAGVAVAQAEYLVKDLGKKKIGLVCATQAFGVQSCDAVKGPIEAAGGTIVAREDTEVTATNLTTQILDLKNKGAEAVLGFQFPNVVVVLLNQAAENGLNVPILAGSSTGLAIATKNVTAAGLKNAIGFDDCAPASEARATDFAAKYRAKFNSEPGYIAAEMYDGIMIIAEAVKKAGKADKKAVADALRTIEYKGACTDYKADAGQGLHHSAVFESFDATGKAKVEKSITVPAPPGGG